MSTAVDNPSASAKLQAVQTMLDEERDLEESQKAVLNDTRERIRSLEGQEKRLQSLLAGNRGKLTIEQVRDAVMRFRGGFTVGEITAELDENETSVRRFIKQLLAEKVIADTH